MRARLLPGLAVALLVAGCGGHRNTDVRGFTQSAHGPAQQAILRSIATYRTTKNAALACSLVTPHFMSGRFEGKLRNCEQVQREASRYLPDAATVTSVTGDSGRVFVKEPTATRSIYRMRRLGGTWKIDDILEAR